MFVQSYGHINILSSGFLSRIHLKFKKNDVVILHWATKQPRGDEADELAM